jgi:type IV fimbrial biogenesis protein FimT
MSPRAHKFGFTLIELLVAVALFALLVTLAVPMYTNFISNSQVRGAAEAMLNGVLAAQTAAVNANTQTQLIVTPATGWQIQFVNPDNSIPAQAPVPPAPYLLSDGAPQATVTTTPLGATELTFDAFGRIIANPDASASISCINVANAAYANARALRVIVSNSSQATGTKLCDPAAAPTEPQACPAAACS